MGGINESWSGCGDRDVHCLLFLIFGSFTGLFFLQEKKKKQKGSIMTGLWVPMVILIVSFGLTFYLYRYFSRKM